MEDYKYLFKVVLIGEAGVGKTCLVRRFTQIWDTAGQEKFRSITQSYYRAAHGLILVYDVCSQNTFDALPQWMTDVEAFANQKVLSYLVGNKTDRMDAREVPTHIGRQFADRYEMNFLETSAKEADNVDKLFTDIAVRLTDEMRDRSRLAPDSNTTNISTNTKSISSCSQCFKP
ncbi:RAB30-like protein [Mya arenaria]|uniref:RAB30-like protein n=1 Tax=Mya arenaria TaxID=6604 RepID=A0ABY7DRY8_MYAAR|nr:RAB30-like protein [Mya arenaria]